MPPRPLSLPFSGRKLRTLRETAGLTLEQLAQKCAEQEGHNVHFTAISKVEVGSNMPSPALLKALAGALGCEVADLLDPEGQPPASERVA